MLEIVLPDIKYINSVKKAIAEYHKLPSPFDINSIKKLDMILNNNIGEYFKSIEASYKAMTTVMKECGGFIDEPYIDNEIKEHRVWINTSF